MHKVGESIQTRAYIGASSATLTYKLYDESKNLQDSGTMTESGSTQWYYHDWTPDAAGEWSIIMDCTTPFFHRQITYPIGKGQGTVIREVQPLTFYLAAEDLSTTEISDDGTNPALLTAASQANANETAGMATPAWSEDYNLEQYGTITVLSIHYLLSCQLKRTGGATAYAKWQISGDGGSNWVDVTDSFTETGTVYVEKIRQGVGLHITSITAGANQLQMRLCAWTDGTTVETRVRSDSYIRVTYRKS